MYGKILIQTPVYFFPVLENTCAIMALPKLLEKKSSKNDQNELLTILSVSKSFK